MVAGTYRTGTLAPGAAQAITARVTVQVSAPVGSKLARKVTLTSLGDTTAKDAVKFVAKRG